MSNQELSFPIQGDGLPHLTSGRQWSRWVIGCGAAAVTSLLAVLVWFFCFGVNYGGMTPEQAEAIAGAVPPGSTREEVEAHLDARGVHHSYIDGSVQDKEGNDTVAVLAGLEEDQVGGTLRGMVGGADLSPLFPGIIRIYFFFNKEGRLIKHLVRHRVLCP